jgi:hypothetical protein
MLPRQTPEARLHARPKPPHGKSLTNISKRFLNNIMQIGIDVSR